ncbi:MAG: hypothetical protein GY857_13960, partial [Desulfobacula sp.]|nr:hypothetical protein [Desulfobacula sp.]
MKHDQKITYSVKYQAGMGIILQSTLKDMGINLKINDLCNELGIGRTTAY